jgi:hypothetical protein
MFLSDFQKRMRYMMFKAQVKRWGLPILALALMFGDVGAWEKFGMFLYYWVSAPFGGGGGGGF